MPRPVRLPDATGRPFLADAGLETSLIFDLGVELPEFAAIALLRTAVGTAALRTYYDAFPPIAVGAGLGLVLDTPTWRSSPDWGAAIGFAPGDLDAANREAVALVTDVRDHHDSPYPVVVSGCVGPRGDGYVVGEQMDAETARAYHSRQIDSFAGTAADVITAMTMTSPAEAIGIGLAARDAGMPVVLSFTVETDGRLPSGHELGDAVVAVDDATDGYPAYYMINCAHPDHFDGVLDGAGAWADRVGGVRANASRRSHAELDVAEDLDSGDPVELAELIVGLRSRTASLAVFGGCCGTNAEHIEKMAHELAQLG